MIDYEKLKLVHELANKCGSSLHYAYQNKEGTHISWVDLDQLILELRELTQPEEPKTKYAVDDIVWILDEDVNLCEFKVLDIDIISDPKYLCSSIRRMKDDVIYVNDYQNWYIEYQLYPTKQALIAAQIDYWQSQKQQNCEHEFAVVNYGTGEHEKLNGVISCSKCGEFYR